MKVTQTRIDLGGFGYLQAYRLSGERGELVHEFAPLREHDRELALVIAEGLDLSETLAVTSAHGETRTEGVRRQSGRYEGELSSAASFDLDSRGASATVAFNGGEAVTLYVAVFKRSKAALRELARFTQGKLLTPAINKFRDRCWACRFLIKALINLSVSGLPAPDPEDIVELLGQLLPADFLEWLLSTDLGEIMGRIGAFLKKLLPKELIAQTLCEQLQFCAAAQQTFPARNVHVCDVRLAGDEAANAQFVEAVRALPSVERQSRFIIESEPDVARVRVFSAERIDDGDLHQIAATLGLKVLEILRER